MIFASLNEQGIRKAEYIAGLKPGATVVTRRMFERVCLKCKKPMFIQLIGKDMYKKGSWPMLTSTCLHCIEGRKLIGIGDLISVCPGRAKAALCSCGHPYDEHCSDPENCLYGDGESACDVDGCKCAAYSRLKLKVVGIMRHTEWAKGHENDDGFWVAESKREGFETLGFWLSVYPKMKVDIDATWRVEMVRL